MPLRRERARLVAEATSREGYGDPVEEEDRAAVERAMERALGSAINP